MRLAAWLRAVLRNRHGAVPRPAWCTYLVTYRCNARCPMCDSWQLKPGDELEPAAVGGVFAQLGRLDVVRLTGGEPFLRRDLPAVAEAIWSASRPLVLHVSTNGSFPQRVAEFVERFPAPRRLRLMVSLDGLEAEHNRNRGRHADFATAMQTIRALVERRATHGLQLSVNLTVSSPQTLADAPALCRELAALHVDVHSVLAYADSAMYGAAWHGRAADALVRADGYPLHPNLLDADVMGFAAAELRRTRSLRSWWGRWGKRYYWGGLLSRLRHERDPRPRPRCVALRSHIRLLPDGRVPVCQFNTQTVGDLRRQTFAEIWHNGRSAAARQWVDQCPGCWAECEVLPNAIYTADILWHRARRC